MRLPLLTAAVLLRGGASFTAPINASVVDGVLTAPGLSPTPIALTWSALNGAIRTVFGAQAPAPIEASLTNATSGSLSFLRLTRGAWLADEPLNLSLRQLVLVLDDVDLVPAASFPPLRGLIEINSTAYSGVVSPGGPAAARIICADAAVSPAAVWSVDSADTVVDGLFIFGCGGTEGGAVHLQGRAGAWAPTVSGGQILNCNITNSSRAIWTETISRVIISGNRVYANHGHAIDFDAFSTASTCVNNIVVGNAAREGIFIEQGASGIVVAGNTIGPGNGNGVAVYNNDMNVTCGPHVIAGNTIVGNLNAGISVGSTAPRAGTPDVGVTVAGNVLRGNGPAAKPQGVHTNGAQVGTVYAANDNADGISLFTQRMAGAANISIIDPLSRERALPY
jgi:hypothetical protein